MWNKVLISYLLCVVLLLQEFIEHFRVLLPKKASASKDDISALLGKKMGLDPTTYQIGKTKVPHAVLYILIMLISLYKLSHSDMFSCFLFRCS